MNFAFLGCAALAQLTYFFKARNHEFYMRHFINQEGIELLIV